MKDATNISAILESVDTAEHVDFNTDDQLTLMCYIF